MSEKKEQISMLELHLGEQFSKLGSEQNWELFLVVFVKKKLLKGIVNIEKSFKATGMGGYLGNKGGILIKFTLFEKTFAFICVHLTAGTNKAMQRSEMMGKIL